MQVSEIQWSKTEKEISRSAFDRAYQREIDSLIQTVTETAKTISDIDQVWQLHDFLSAKRHEIDGKYDYQYSSLIFVFARLVREQWLSIDELEGLEAEKLAKISALVKML
ncbi:hypothetical protein [Leptolyngbya sp. NIES-2104]|uniref:hypothetical protein n=1 Tax=Leptolyngbya sp. NIES-2104 TaxID=1552121 RepID=UPI0006ECAE63|nr:hypothetical protein [Leptolyngbya sp. NIES-2104]GAP94519.1 hypothetical protein NIES2104_10300 [Leptolyngbya sp. NIES-2104]